MLAVGGWAGVCGYRGALWSRGGYSTAFVGNAWRLPEGVAADVHGACERMVAWGRLGSSSGGAGYGGARRRSSGSHRPSGELGGGESEASMWSF